MDASQFVARVDHHINAALSAQAPEGLERSQILLEAGRHLATAPGAKRARPRLVYCFGKIMGVEDYEALWRVALSAEFIHGASLLHDDVVDGGTQRRGRPTANAQWSNAVAVLGGDVMLCLSIEALSLLPRQITNEAVALVATMSRAAVLEVETRGVLDLSLEQWRVIAQGKTGALFGWCGRAPAHLAEDRDAAARFTRCGELLGIAFQLADDLKDMVDPGSGKNPFADIRNKNPSYPLLWSIRQDASLQRDLGALWEQPEIALERASAIGQRVLEAGAADHTRGQIVEHVGRAFEALGDYRERPGGQEVIDWALSLSQDYIASTT